MNKLQPKHLQADQRGLAEWLRRTGKQLPEMQYIRELVQNAFDAEASNVLIDTAPAPEGVNADKLRISDDGSGMTSAQLVDHITTLHRSGRGRRTNFGIGARLATLSRNPAGVYWASTVAKRSAQILVRDSPTGFALIPWDLGDGTEAYAVPADPDIHGDLPRKAGKGTSVVMIGARSGSITGGDTIVRNAATYLSRRYWASDGVAVRYRTGQGQGAKAVLPTGAVVARDATVRGIVHLDGTVPATAEWFLLQRASDRDRQTSGQNARSTLAAVYEGELFAPADLNRFWTAFGIPLASVRSRLVIVVEPNEGEVTMNNERTHLVRSGDRAIPWSDWGRLFADQMPAEIASLLDAAQPRTTLDQRLLDRLRLGQQGCRDPSVAAAPQRSGPVRRGRIAGRGHRGGARPTRRREGRRAARVAQTAAETAADDQGRRRGIEGRRGTQAAATAQGPARRAR